MIQILAVVAVVHFTRESRKKNGHESVNLDALITHPLEKLVRHTPAPHIIIDEAHLHALASLGDECVSHQISQRVVLYQIGVDMDMVLR